MSVHVKLLCMYIILNIVMYVGQCMCLYIISIRCVCVCTSSSHTCYVSTLINHCMSAL